MGISPCHGNKKVILHQNSENTVQNNLHQQDKVKKIQQGQRRCESDEKIHMKNRSRFQSNEEKREVVQQQFVNKQVDHFHGQFDDCNTKLQEIEILNLKGFISEDSESSIDIQIGDLQNNYFDVDANAIEFRENIILDLIPKQEIITLRSVTQQLPVVVNLETYKISKQCMKPSIDLISVVDVSQSMNGQNIELVIDSLRYIQNSYSYVL